MNRAACIWAAYLGGGLAYDVLCGRRRNETTLSSVTRRVVAATPSGKAIFTVGLAASGIWFWDHIVAPLADAVDESLADLGGE